MARTLFAAVLSLFLLPGAVQAQDAYPVRPVRIIVPFPPGGVTDLAARLVGQSLSAKWDKQVVVENKPGASGIVGVETVVRSTPDGYTLLMATDGEIAINPAIFAKLPYDSQKDLIPVAMVTTTPFVWCANLNAHIDTLADLVKEAKARPDEIAYSSAGVGSSAHMATVQFATAAGIKLLHVPYRGGAPAANAIQAGEVPVAAVALSSALPIIASGKVNLLAITSEHRNSLVPDVPTVAETGVLKDLQSAIWTGLFAPSGTPEAVVAKIQADVIEVLKDPSVTERLRKLGADAVGLPGDQLKPVIANEIDQMTALAKAANIHLD